MQRYHASGCTSAVNHNAIGGASARETARADSSSVPSNLSLSSRRPSPLKPYKLRCDKEPLNSRLGPPDFLPQTPNCPEESLTREYVQSGYRETVDGLEEAREVSLTQVQTFTKPLVVNCKDAIRKRLRAINESRAQKRKAGQVYGVPLSGSQLTKPGVFPELRPCGEDFRKKWIEGLSQQHKRLRSLADNVPQGYKRGNLFEVLIRNNVPLLRATWFIKITYLNQVRPGSGSSDRTQLARTELWTKDVVEYLQSLLDDFFSKNSSHPTSHSRDLSTKMSYSGLSQHKGDPASAVVDSQGPTLHFKWWYMVRLLQWHQEEGLLLPSLIIDWVLSQLQEKEVLEALQLVLPIIYGVLETIIQSQTYVRILVRIAVRFISESSPGGSDLVENSRRTYTISSLVEMLRYLILAVPDTFVALDCFPLPSCVTHPVTDGNFASKASDDGGKRRYRMTEVSALFTSKDLDSRYQSISFGRVVSSIQKRADNLAKAAKPGYIGNSVAKVVETLDKSLVQGEISGVYKYLFEDFCDGAVNESWIKEVSLSLRSTMKWLRTVSLSFVSSVFFLCEWATCDFSDIRTAPSREMKFTGGEDFSPVYIAIRILKMKIMDLQSSYRHKNDNSVKANTSLKPSTQQNNQSGMTSVGSLFEPKSHSKNMEGRSKNPSDMFKSPGPLHDIIVCWIDQHDVQKGKGFRHLQLLIFELIRAGIFYPHSYVRQLIVSGIMDTNGPAVDSDRRRRHHQILKQFPGNFLHDSLEEAKIAQGPQLLEIMHAYSSERRLVLRGLVYDQDNDFSSYASTSSVHKQRKQHSTTEDGVYRASVNHLKAVHSSPNMLPSKKSKSHADIEELKVAISVLLRFPNGLSTSPDTVSDESQGINAKRSFASIYSKLDGTVGTPGCEECIRAKKQKLSEERSSYLQAPSPLPSDEEDTWWVRKGSKSSESLKVEPQVKSTKIIPKSRQKGVLKTLSLAQLAAARIEGSQGASTSHVCDNRVNCPHHRTGAEGETLKPVDWIRTSGDIVLVGKALKGLRLVEKSAIASWLIAFIRQLIEETEKSTAKAGQFGRTVTPVDERSLGWKLGEDELSAILYFMDCCNDLLSAVKFLLWLLPRVLIPANSTINSRRGSLILPKNSENQVCEVGEAHLISSLRRYENILIATDLIPEALSSTISRATSILVSNGRVSSSAAMAYARYLLKKYNNVSRVIEWEKNFKATCDKRLLSELESGWSIDGELGFPLGVPSGVEDPDDFFRQKISGGRLSRVGMGMRDLVQRHVEDAFNNYFGKERKLFAGGPPKSSSLEKLDDGYQIAQQISTGMIDCMRQTGGAAQEGDPSLVSSAVSAIVNSVGLTLSKIPDFLSGTGSGSSSTGLLNFARRILHIHISCLCLLKEALGERQNRVFDIALAIEASSALSGFFPPGRSSSLAHDSNTNISSENMKMVVGRAAKIAAAVSALVIGAVVQGVTSLERLVSLFKLKEGLDFIQFIRNTRSNSNGNSRSGGAFKMDNGIEVYVHWFRVLVGNCRTVFDGSIVELLGEPSIVALSRMQRMLPLTLVLPPAYSIFAFLIWRPFIPTSSLVSREDPNQFYQSLTMAMSDAIRHLPFRDVCLRDSLGFYDLVSADSSDVEFAAILDLNGLDLHTKSMAFVPLRARLFLNGLIDCKIPDSIDDWSNRVSGFGDFKISYPDSKTKLLARLVHVLDTLQPAKFHWQWVELRLLLNEQGLIDKLETQDISLANAIRSSSPSPEKNTVSENEKNFIEIILTRLLVRPDAAPLFSDVIHLFGRLLENSMLLQAKWFLGGPDVLLGRKSIRKKLINIAEGKGLSTKSQFWKPWGWYNTDSHDTPSGDKKKLEASHLEEGEVVEEGVGDSGKSGRVGPTQTMESEGFNVSQQYVTEKALIDLVLPCIDQSSEDSRNTFANDLIKQLSNIEQQISAITRGSSKLVGPTPSGIEGPISKSSSRKGMKGGSPGLARRSAVGPVDSAPPTPAALKASLSLRLRLLLRLLPVIRADGEPSGRNMRHMLASVILRLLGSRAVHEDADVTLYPGNSAIFEEVESPSEASSTVYSDLAGESLFDRLLLVLHGLLSTSQPSWLRSKPASKSTYDSNKDSNGLDHELAESLQNDLERIEMPETVRSRIQAAMPILHPSVWCPVSCPPPTVPISALASLHPSSLIPGISPGNPSGPHGTKAPSSRAAANKNVKSKNILVQPDYDMEIDPWILLEEGAGSGQSSSNSASIGGSDHANLKASSFLKGAVRVRRTDLMYIGVVDDES